MSPWGQSHFLQKNISNFDIHLSGIFFIVFVTAYLEVNLLRDISRYNGIFSHTLMKILKTSYTMLRICPRSDSFWVSPVCETP